MANDTKYGLATTVWTTNLARAHRIAAKIDVGICWINSWFLRDLRTAFGGSKDSGIGREGGVHSLEFYTELRNVCVKLDAEKDAPVERREANSAAGWDREPGKETVGAQK
jgi:aminomuconate-semialdehyde/2-hydroxymuconate-6-semialdehyde dehydrogenase